MGQKQADQKAVVAHSCVLNPVLSFSVGELRGAQAPVLWGMYKLGNLCMTVREGESHRAKGGLKGVDMLWKFKESRSQ